MLKYCINKRQPMTCINLVQVHIQPSYILKAGRYCKNNTGILYNSNITVYQYLRPGRLCWELNLLSILWNPSFSTEYSGITSLARQNLTASVSSFHFLPLHSYFLALSNAQEMVVCPRLTDLKLDPHFFNSCFFTTSACFNG